MVLSYKSHPVGWQQASHPLFICQVTKRVEEWVLGVGIRKMLVPVSRANCDLDALSSLVWTTGLLFSCEYEFQRGKILRFLTQKCFIWRTDLLERWHSNLRSRGKKYTERGNSEKDLVFSSGWGCTWAHVYMRERADVASGGAHWVPPLGALAQDPRHSGLPVSTARQPSARTFTWVHTECVAGCPGLQRHRVEPGSAAPCHVQAGSELTPPAGGQKEQPPQGAAWESQPSVPHHEGAPRWSWGEARAHPEAWQGWAGWPTYTLAAASGKLSLDVCTLPGGLYTQGCLQHQARQQLSAAGPEWTRPFPWGQSCRPRQQLSATGLGWMQPFPRGQQYRPGQQTSPHPSLAGPRGSAWKQRRPTQGLLLLHRQRTRHGDAHTPRHQHHPPLLEIPWQSLPFTIRFSSKTHRKTSTVLCHRADLSRF